MSNNKITIIQLNDLHGYLEEHLEHFWDGDHPKYLKVGGLSRIKTFIDKVKKETDNNFIFLDGGDTFHGTYPVVSSKGEVLIPLLNDLSIDAMTAHWDFAYGPEHLYNIVDKLNYPLIACNCYHKDTEQLVFPPYIIKEVNGVKFGILGVAATIVDKTMPKHFSQGIYLTLGNKELPKYIKELKEKGADIIMLNSHLGFPQELQLAQEVDGIDIILSAHTHNRVYEPSIVNDTIIIQSGCHGSFLGKLELNVVDGNIKSYEHELVVLDDKYESNKEMKNNINQVMKPLEDKLGKVLGYTETNLDRYQVLESTMDNFLLQSLIDYTGAEVAFSNGWRYGAPIPKGPITENHLWNIIPVNPPVSTTKITGQELWDMMEENLDRTFAKNPYDQMGGYVKRCLGLNLYFKIENPRGERIQEFFINGRPLEKDRFYNAVFVTSQGVPEKYGKERTNLDINAIDALKLYLKKKKTIISPIIDTIVAV
ncbi:MAG TPA: bifunctional metallophosphatase/5'-nucleotidase [Clostridiales bacterium]|nr:bifunctional metallophosphatase/5'-nucleotidase [Clostridiales bacterium]